MRDAKIAIIIFNLGTPNSKEELEPYLRNIFSDPNIIKLSVGRYFLPALAKIIAKMRVKKAREYYQSIGGVSPLLQNTIKQANKLANKLSGNKDVKVYVAMRYWHPFLEEVIDEIANDYSKVVLLPMYPQYSKVTTGAFYSHFNNVCLSKRIHFEDVRYIKSYYDDELFISALAGKIIKVITINNFLDGGKFAIILSAHSVPRYIYKDGDPYIGQIYETAELLKKRLEEGISGDLVVRLGFQSRLGIRRWVGPFVQDIIKELVGRSGIENLVIVPISFVADNIETIYELGMLYRTRAMEMGVKNYQLVDCVNDDDEFIECLYRIVLNEIELAGGGGV
jgi:ferrochelatase